MVRHNRNTLQRFVERDKVPQKLLDATLAAEGAEAAAQANRERLELRLARLKAAHQRRKRAKLDEERARRGVMGFYAC